MTRLAPIAIVVLFLAPLVLNSAPGAVVGVPVPPSATAPSGALSTPGLVPSGPDVAGRRARLGAPQSAIAYLIRPDGPRPRHADPTPRPTAKPRPRPTIRLHAAPRTPVEGVVRSGIATWMPERFGAGYLALPDGPGVRVRICGAGGCLVMTSNDAGPDRAMQRQGRIADIGVRSWEAICGVSRSLGLCQVSIVVMGR